MSDDLIRRAEEALEGITPGPGEVDEPDRYGGFSVWHDDGLPGITYICHEVWQGHDSPAEFIAAAPDLVRDLLAAVQRVEALADKVRYRYRFPEVSRDIDAALAGEVDE